MKKSILFTVLVALLVATSCAGSTEQVAGQKKTAPKREGWDRLHLLSVKIYAATDSGYGSWLFV